jgi:hypothetical protein
MTSGTVAGKKRMGIFRWGITPSPCAEFKYMEEGYESTDFLDELTGRGHCGDPLQCAPQP